MTKLTKDLHQHPHMSTPEQNHAEAAKVSMAAKKSHVGASKSRSNMREALKSLQQNSVRIEEGDEGQHAAGSKAHGGKNEPLQGAFNPPRKSALRTEASPTKTGVQVLHPASGRKSALKKSGAEASGVSKGSITIDENKNEVREYTKAPYELSHSDPFNAKLSGDQRLQFEQAVKTNTVQVHEKSFTVMWPQGQMYKGELTKTGEGRGRPHGNGVVTLPNGRSYPSTWSRGTCQRLLGATGGDSLEDVEPAVQVAQYKQSLFDKLTGNR